MGDRFSLVLDIIAAAVFVVGTLIIVSLWRSESHRKWFYLFLTFYAFGWVRILDWLFPLIAVPRPWQDGVEAVLFALAVVGLMLLYRHRHDPDPDPYEL